jgi:diacylglycerol kinase family enzyme
MTSTTSIVEGRRLVIAHNPHSSRAHEVQSTVFARLDTAGYTYETIEVRQASLRENIEWLQPQLQANDIVLCTAGDGSAHAVTQAALAANLPGVQIGFLAFGNFNDLSHTFNTPETLRDPVAFLERAEVQTLYPLEVTVNDTHFRYALLYCTIGWTARAAARFDQPDIRHRLQSGEVGMVRNLWKLGCYYFQSRRRNYLPSFTLDRRLRTHLTDILCVNGPTMARLFKTGKKYYQESFFLYKKLNVRGLLWNASFLLRSTLWRMPGKEKMHVTLDFVESAVVPIQCDGEVEELHDVMHIHIKKNTKALSVLATK